MRENTGAGNSNEGQSLKDETLTLQRGTDIIQINRIGVFRLYIQVIKELL